MTTGSQPTIWIQLRYSSVKVDLGVIYNLVYNPFPRNEPFTWIYCKFVVLAYTRTHQPGQIYTKHVFGVKIYPREMILKNEPLFLPTPPPTPKSNFNILQIRRFWYNLCKKYIYFPPTNSSKQKGEFVPNRKKIGRWLRPQTAYKCKYSFWKPT